MTTASNSSPNDVQQREVARRLNGGAQFDHGTRIRLERAFDPQSEGDWLNLLRDMAAIANSVGGDIVLRMPSGAAEFARGELLRRLNDVSDSSFDELELRPLEGSEGTAILMSIGPALFPIVFTKAGRYAGASGSEKEIEAFSAGGIYFWHGDKSEPGSSGDLREFLERLLRRVRRRWLAGIRRVLKTPVDSVIQTSTKRARDKRAEKVTQNLQPVRITTDPDAPALQPQDVDRLYPWRQKDLLHELNGRLGRRELTTYDIQAVRRHHRLDERPDFVFHLPGAGRRYSPAVADWMLQELQRDPEFFKQARFADQAMLKLRRQKPK